MNREINQIFLLNNIDNNRVSFSKDESHHIINVKKIPRNSIFYASDGSGIIYKLKLSRVKNKIAFADILEIIPTENESNQTIIIASSIPGKTRLEFMVEKLTELGMNEFFPLISKRSKYSRINVERLEKISISAMKQSRRSKLPKINPPLKIEEIFYHFKDKKKFYSIVLDSEIGRTDLIPEKKDIIFFIGPEGGWSKEEIRIFKKFNCNFLSFGKSTLRIETAAIAGLVYYNMTKFIEPLPGILSKD